MTNTFAKWVFTLLLNFQPIRFRIGYFLNISKEWLLKICFIRFSRVNGLINMVFVNICVFSVFIYLQLSISTLLFFDSALQWFIFFFLLRNRIFILTICLLVSSFWSRLLLHPNNEIYSNDSYNNIWQSHVIGSNKTLIPSTVDRFTFLGYQQLPCKLSLQSFSWR